VIGQFLLIVFLYFNEIEKKSDKGADFFTLIASMSENFLFDPRNLIPSRQDSVVNLNRLAS
jgi:hypothetical protein